MLQLLMSAYDVLPDQVSGPDWISGDLNGSNCYVIDATMPPETTKVQFQLMLQNLLAQRFHLVVHHETQSFPGYDLVVAKVGPKLKESKPLPTGPQTVTIPLPGAQRVTYHERSMAQLAVNLQTKVAMALGANLFADPGARKPRVRDKTGLTGKYDFTLEFSCEGCGGAEQASELPDIFTAIEKQLGLRLEKVKDVPVDVIVVDRVDKVPTAN